MTDRIAEIRERASRATEGPWCVSDIAGDFILVLGNDDRYTAVPVLSDTLDPSVLDGPTLSKTSRKRNAEFLAHAREDIPYLLAQLDAARAEVERLRAELEKYPKTADGVRVIPERFLWSIVNTRSGPCVGLGWVRIYHSDEPPDDGETGRLFSKCYSTREAAEAAKEKP